MRRRRMRDDQIVVFPRNHLGDASPGAAHASWGPDHSIRAMTAGEVVMIDRGSLIATFALRIRVGPGVAFYFRGFRLVQWGPDGQRVFPPSRKTSLRVVDDDGNLIRARDRYHDLITFDSNAGARAFEEAALAAARYAVARHRSEQCEPAAAFDDDGAVNADDVPF